MRLTRYMGVARLLPVTVAVAALVLSIVLAPAAEADQTSLASCTLRQAGSEFKGPCGALLAVFDHVPAVTLQGVKRVSTGRWRDDVMPLSVWGGSMADDDQANDPIELELYQGAWGILRTEAGWFPVTNFRASPGKLTFDLYAFYQISPSPLDREIVQRASALLSNSATWNRADNRECPKNAATLSIYCAMEKATIQLTGGFQHRRPALQLVRGIIDERSAGRDYQHRLMDYNNDPRTRLRDVQSLFKEALARMGDVQWLKTHGFARPFGDGFRPG
jgi:hypothetical protein